LIYRLLGIRVGRSTSRVVSSSRARRALDSAGAGHRRFRGEAGGGDRRSDRIERQAEFILATVAETPDITLAELREKLIAERGESFGTTSIWRFFARRGVSYKKAGLRSDRATRHRAKGS